MSENGKPKSDEPAPPSFSLHTEIDCFIINIEALKTTLPFAVTVLQAIGFKETKDFSEFLDTSGELKSETETVKTYAIGPDVLPEVVRRRRNVDRFIRGSEILPRSFLVSLISQYDYFLGRILRCLYYLKPDLLHSSERTLTFSQLLEFGDIQAAREYLIVKEIETLLRKSHVEQFEWLENKFSMPLRTELPSWPHFVELTQRRNLFTHSNGVVSSQYLNVCDKHEVRFGDARPAVGTTLPCPSEYFQQAFECTFEIGVKLAQVLWRKVRPDQIADADKSITGMSFELLLSEEYALLIRLLDFFTHTLKQWSSDELRRIVTVNHAQAHKWSGNNEAALKLIDKEDWTASAHHFKLAAAVLRDQFDEAAKLVKQIGISDAVAKKDYEEWPLFREFRKSEQFLSAYEEVYGEPFVAIERASDAPGPPAEEDNT